MNKLANILPFKMIVRDVTNKISVAELKKEQVPDCSSIRLIHDVSHAGFIFGKVIRRIELGKKRNLLRYVFFHVHDILFRIFSGAKIILLKEYVYKLIKIHSGISMVSDKRLRCSTLAVVLNPASGFAVQPLQWRKCRPMRDCYQRRFCLIASLRGY
jgi:hypothetical protein